MAGPPLLCKACIICSLKGDSTILKKAPGRIYENIEPVDIAAIDLGAWLFLALRSENIASMIEPCSRFLYNKAAI